MNSFLRAIGFSKYTSKNSIRDLISAAAIYPEAMDYINEDSIGKIYEFKNFYADGIGIKFYGSESDDLDYEIDYFVPFVEGNKSILPTDLSIEKRYSNFSFIASCEDLRVGVSMIFHLTNPMDYMNFIMSDSADATPFRVCFSALSLMGTILLPINLSPGDARKQRMDTSKRSKLIAAARDGDEGAIESLTFDDMDTYAKISRRIQKEDVFSIVESSFMPYGLESDLYTIIAEIDEVSSYTNRITNELIYRIVLSYNDVPITLAINSLDLVGEPMVGRRFKGTIWLQGQVLFNMEEK
ncbi:MAG: DUF3881 family protein [Clostridiales bacterium]|nr:DUF3881 family protein [Clostridiales bacterium]